MAAIASLFLVIPLVLQLYLGRLDISRKRFVLVSLGNFLLSWLLIAVAVRVVNWSSTTTLSSGRVESVNVAVFGCAVGLFLLIVIVIQAFVRRAKR